MNDNYCNNCGKQGHLYHQCKMPITSIGIIVFRYNEQNNIEYLMIRRKDTLGFIDFMRGKYSIYNKEYLINMFKQMTNSEKERIRNMSFDELWKDIWKTEHISSQYKLEEVISKESKLLNHYDIYYFIDLKGASVGAGFKIFSFWVTSAWSKRFRC